MEFTSSAQQRDPQVTIIIPTYNRASLIGSAIESVLRQSFVDFELIVVDDGSSDNTPDIVASFAHDRRLVYLVQENRGRSAARNRAINLARGRYVAFLDSDDLYLHNKLAEQISFLDAHDDVDMIYTSAECINSDGTPLPGQKYTAWAEGNIYELVAFFQPVTITLPTVMLRKEVLDRVGGFDESMERFEDTDLWRRIAKSHRIAAMPQVTCILRTHADNALDNQDPVKIIKSIQSYTAKIFLEDEDMGQNFLRTGASGLFEYYGRAFIGRPGKRGYGVFLLRRAMGYAPKRAGVVLVRGLRTYVGSLVRQVMEGQA